MIELRQDRMVFSFPEVHQQATLTIDFKRTLRIPDNDGSSPLPPGLGLFPLRHVDDFADGVPAAWLQRGGVMMPMYQAEALWLGFHAEHVYRRQTAYPFAIKVAAGKHCAVSGDSWTDGLTRNPQNYMVAPGQPWLDGYVVEKGKIRQFVAMPLGAGYSAEEQISGTAEHGGLQLAVYPMKREVFERRFPERDEFRSRSPRSGSGVMMSKVCVSSPDMGLAPGGMMEQEIYEDPFEMSDWDMTSTSRCFVHLCNSMVWNSITGTQPPYPPPTAKQYAKAKLPWYAWYDESATAVSSTDKLKNLKSIAQLSAEKGTVVLPENEPVTPENLIVYRSGLKPGQVREGKF